MKLNRVKEYYVRAYGNDLLIGQFGEEDWIRLG